MPLPAMITAITAGVGRRGRSQTAVCVQHGELPRPAPSGSYSVDQRKPADRAGLSHLRMRSNVTGRARWSLVKPPTPTN
jgi:hypothetical protein